jgi:ATP-binding cassette subfamily C (CFTR/MRP) protein 1
MSAPSFITAEESRPALQSWKTLWRFLNSLTLLKRIFPISFILIVLATSSPQIFLWLTGEYTQCSNPQSCSVHISLTSQSIEISPQILLWFAIISTLIRIASWAIFEISGEWAAQGLHRQMVSAVSTARTTFFDENPSGRLINRLVRDFDNLRTTGVVRVSDTLYTALETLCIAALVFLAHPLAALLVIPTLIVFIYIQRQVSPMLQRIATLKSVRFGDVLHRETDLIEGARTFLLYGKQGALFERLKQSLARFIQINLLRAEVEAWGRFWTSSVTSLYCFATISFVALAIHLGSITTVLGAVIITVIFRLSPLFSWLTWTTSYLIESMATARRVLEFVDLPNETSEELGPEASPVVAAAATESLLGDIEFFNYSMSYRPNLPLILNGLNLKLPYGQRIGLIGRTGAGKSSIVQSLFRMVYVHAGDIKLGGQSIFAYPIDVVRGRFAVVPQDPYLFEGTVKTTLDRAGVLAPGKLISALELVGISLPLDYRIEEGGKNLSLGERQLLCLARVLLLDRPYLIMDEPTSAVDSVTDRQIQNVLGTAFKGRTIITVAHRLETLANYDLIVVLKDGAVSRIGSPAQILPGISQRELE